MKKTNSQLQEILTFQCPYKKCGYKHTINGPSWRTKELSYVVKCPKCNKDFKVIGNLEQTEHLEKTQKYECEE